MGDKGHQANIHFVPNYGKLISKYVYIIVIELYEGGQTIKYDKFLIVVSSNDGSTQAFRLRL